MERIFKIDHSFRGPDGTIIAPFLNSKDSESRLPFNLLDGFSLTAGIIEPESESKIHSLPLVTQVTFCLSGIL